MTFSVIVPIYNVEQFLCKCVDSVLNQTYSDFELILVDDGSTDKSAEICDSYIAKDHRIKVIHKANGGLVSARKAGVAVATCDYAICVDGDDWISEDYLQKFAEVIEKDSPDVICCGYYKAKNGDYTPVKYEINGLYKKEDIEKTIFPTLIQNSRAEYFAPSVWAKAFSMSIYKNNQLAVDDGLSIGEDCAVTIPCIYHADSLYVLSDCLYYYRINDSSLTRKKKPFSWEGPKLIADVVSKGVDLTEFDFKAQLDRKLCHEIFLVAVSSFWKDDKYRNIKKDVKANLNRELYKNAIKNSKFSGSSRAKLMRLALKWRMLFLLRYYSKRR